MKDLENGDLIAQLRTIVGEGNVLAGDDDRSAFDHDATGKYAGRSLAVVRPGSTEEVAKVLRLAHATGTPVVPQSGNTGLAGGAAAGADGDRIILSLQRMNRIRDIRPAARVAVVEAGVILDSLHQAAAEHGLSFPLIFGARGTCLIGGNLSTNAGGSNVLRYGNTRGLCLGIEVVTPEGEIVDLMSQLHKDNTGYDLKDLFIGAEGTLGVITAAVLKLVRRPDAYATAMLSVGSVGDALGLLNRLQAATGGLVEAFEYMPRRFMEFHAERRPEVTPPLAGTHDHMILVELGATALRDTAPNADGSVPITELLSEILAEEIEAGHVLDAVVAQSGQQRKVMWSIREAAYEVTVRRGPSVDSDICLPLDRIEDFLATMAANLPGLAPKAVDVSVAHLGDGNIHYTVLLPDGADHATRDRVMSAVEDQVQALGGSFSAEHGIGLTKLPSMQRRKNPAAIALMKRIKSALDPKGIMNPGKVLPE